MTPQHYAKLAAQAARQTNERDALIAAATALQPAIDNAQQWADAAQASLDAAQAALVEAQETEGADVATAQASVDAAQAALTTAKAGLATQTSEQAALNQQAAALTAAIATCEAEMAASGLNLSAQALADIYAAYVAARAASLAQDQDDEQQRLLAKADATIVYLVTHTKAQIETKIDTDITNLATAKTYIAKLAVAVSVLARRELR